jgi:hypothetical protein
LSGFRSSEEITAVVSRRNGLEAAKEEAPRLNEHVQHLALIVDGAPQIHLPTIDQHDHFIEVPAVVSFRPGMPQVSRNHRTKLQDPAADGLVADIQASLAANRSSTSR